MTRKSKKVASVKLRSLERSLPMELLKTREVTMSYFKPMLREYGLTEQQWRVIRVLAAYGQLEASELAHRSILLAPSLTRILQFLVSEGLVDRLSHQSDQRRALLQLSSKGEQLFAKVAPAAEAIYVKMEKTFGADRMEAMYRLLADFYGSVGRE
jgi:homoprotocatechuate degradation regulator HpaR